MLLRSRTTLVCGCSSTIKSSGVPMSGARSHIVLHRRLDLRTRGGSMLPACDWRARGQRKFRSIQPTSLFRAVCAGTRKHGSGYLFTAPNSQRVRMAFRPEPSSSRTVVVPQRLVKSNRKSTAAPAPAPGPTPQQLELERLTTENARLSLAQTEASEGLAAAQEDLLVAQKREAALSDLMSSAGCDTVELGPLSWSIDSAQQLLDDEVATRRALQVRRLPTIHTPHLSCVCRCVCHCCTHILTRAGAAGAN